MLLSVFDDGWKGWLELSTSKSESLHKHSQIRVYVRARNHVRVDEALFREYLVLVPVLVGTIDVIVLDWFLFQTWDNRAG